MSEKFDLVLKDATVVTPKGPVAADIAITDGKIAALGAFRAHQTKNIEDIFCSGS